MKRLAFGLAAACVACGLAAAQTTTAPGTGAGTTGTTGTTGTLGTPGTTGTNGTMGAGGSTATSTGTGTGTGTAAGTGTGIGTGVGNAVNRTLPNRHDKAAASGDNNQAVVTTDANASQPAHGSNSFTAAQARGRIQDKGFANVTDLKKDNGGVWRGKAEKNGQTVSVWLDYKGNVGQ